MKEASIPGLNAQNEEDRQTAVPQGSRAGIGSCAVLDKGCVVAQGSMHPGFWSPVPCHPEGLFRDAKTTDHFHMTKISKCTFTESSCLSPQTASFSQDSPVSFFPFYF